MRVVTHIGAVVNPRRRHVEADESPAAPDGELIRRAARGDQEAFALLYHRHKQDAWSLASFRLRDAHEAEDAVQDTFLRAYRGLDAYHGGESARAWLLTICRNVCLDRLRTRLSRGLTFLEDRGEGPEIAMPGADVDRRLDLRMALAELPVEDAEAFFFVDVLGCRSHEAARIVGVRAPSTLRSRLDRARRHLAEAIAEPAAPAPGPEVRGILHRPPERVLVVSFAGDGAGPGGGPRGPASSAPAGSGLVRFFELLEERIPAGRRVLALLGASGAGCLDTATPWIAGHPRWRLRLSCSRESWLRDAERMLTADARERELELLRSSRSFVWTPDR